MRPDCRLGGRFAAALAATTCLSAAHAPAAFFEFPSDRVIVRLKGGAPARNYGAADRQAISARLSVRGGELMLPHRVMGDGAQVMKLFRRLSGEQVRQRFAGLQDPDVAEVVPDRIFFPAATPSDPLFSLQWSLGATNGIDAAPAWDVTTGANNLIVGILDTGSLPHDDLAGRWIGGYDFVSLLERANDGDLRDADPSDPGDWVTPAESASGPLAGCPVAGSSWHGTAIAGVIGAAANNGIGIAGINWNSRILPVRVAGKCGGYESDIADGMRWAAGIAVAGVPDNANIANLLNVSLSAAGTCSTTLQSAINEVLTAGVPVIAAAGNDGLASSGASPGNCAGVITVGAVDKNGGKPAYANYGDPIAVAAPGGTGTASTDAILTTLNASLTSPDANSGYYATVDGTSVAAAHVTGIASLAMSLNPMLRPQFLKQVLQEGSRAFATNTTALGSDADCTTGTCGAGVADAGNSVPAANDWGITAPRVLGGLQLSQALRADGTLYLWGTGQPGPNAGISSTTPVAVNGLDAVVQLAGDLFSDHALVLRADGTVWAWGSNNMGQLGDGTQVDRPTPVQVPGLNAVVAVAAGFWTSLALRTDGTVWSWGRDYFDSGSKLTPTLVPGLTGVTAIATDGTGAYAVKSDGTAWYWGSPSVLPQAFVPTQITEVGTVLAVAAGDTFSLFLKSDHTTAAIGLDIDGQLGDGGTVAGSFVFTQVANLTNVVAISAGNAHGLALKDDGSVWAWGNNFYGQLGDETTNGRNAPVRVLNVTAPSSIAAGSIHSLAVKPDGSVWEWGNGGQVQHDPGLATQVAGVGGSGFLNLGVADPGNFAPQTDVLPAVLRTSNAITVRGIASGAAIGIDAGQYSVGCTGTFTSAPGTIDPGQTVCVQLRSAPNCAMQASATLTIAGFSAKTFNVSNVSCELMRAFELDLVGTGTGVVTVTKPDGTLICGMSCEESFFTGTPLTLSAAPGNRSTFTGWQVTCLSIGSTCRFTPCVIGNTCTITMDTPVTVRATFTHDPIFLPSAPQNLAATAGDSQASFTFTAPANDGGADIVSYTVTCTVSGVLPVSASNSGSPITVTGLTNGVPYTCFAQATNSQFTGFSSSPVSVTPFSPSLTLAAVKSRKAHGAVGTFDLPIDDTKPIGGAVTNEPRQIGAGHQVVFQFDGPAVMPGSATAVDVNGNPIGTASATSAGNEVTVTLAGIPDASRVTVSLTGVNIGTSASASLGFLVGDVDETRQVTSNDILGTKARSGQAVNSSNYLFDIDASGSVTSNDVNLIKNRAGYFLP